MDRKINVKKIVNTYLKHLPKNIRVKLVFLFGSYATGKIREDSDIDLIIVSPDFKKVEFMKRLELLSHIQGRNLLTRSVPMDIIGYTPEEFENIDKESIVMRQAKREGKIIYQTK